MALAEINWLKGITPVTTQNYTADGITNKIIKAIMRYGYEVLLGTGLVQTVPVQCKMATRRHKLG